MHVHCALLMQQMHCGIGKSSGAGSGGENVCVAVHDAIAHDGLYLSRLGSKKSRRPSPKVLKASTSSEMAMPGAMTRCGATVRNSRLAPSMVPHSGAGGCTPSPRNPSAEP